MSVKREIASIMAKDGQMFEWATKAKYNLNMSAEDKEISEVVDVWAREIGRTGNDKDDQIAEFILKTVTPDVYDAPDELLDTMFDRGSIGEFDDFAVNVAPKNTLVAYDAAKGGTVDKSYIDTSVLTPTYNNKQIETEISFAELRRGGYKTVANLTTWAKEAMQNALVFDIFNAIDAAITGDEQSITSAGGLTEAAMDKLALYLIDRVDGSNAPICFTLNKFAQQIAKMSGYDSFLSDGMKDDFNRFGLVKMYQGVRIGGISGAKRTGKNELLLPDNKIFGVAGKIGTLNMRGDIHVYEDSDISRERIRLKIADFEYGYVISDIDKVCKITVTSSAG